MNQNGKTWLEVFYDAGLLDYDAAIAAGLAAFGLKPGQVRVICRPTPADRRGDHDQKQGQLFSSAEV